MFPDKRFLNIFATISLSILDLIFVSWMLRLPITMDTFVVIITTRITASIVFFNDYKLSWTKASSRTAYLKVIIGAITLVIYAPIVLYIGGTGRRILFTDFVFFHFVQLSILYTYRQISYKKREGSKNVVIYGSGDDGNRVKEDLIKSGHKINWFIDDSKEAQVGSIDGIKILSIKDTIKKIKNSQRRDLLIFAFPVRTSRGKIRRRYNRLRKYFKVIKVLPPRTELLETQSYFQQLREVSVEELLARNPKDLDSRQISSFVKGRSVLVTGAGGSIGSELVEQCYRYGARCIILLDHSEFSLYTLLEKYNNDKKLIPVMQSVTCIKTYETVFKKFQPEIVLHAAAYKHVPLVEFNVDAAVFNNIVGTKNTVDLAIKYNTEKFVMVSTDKAVRPTNIMGATKRICELYAQNSNGRSNTEFVIVRFGNVLGSSGSVIPKFKKQMEENKNITVTHPDVTRYFMLIPEACELVLQAASIANGGEIFILDMGQPVRIAGLAEKLLELSGRDDLKIEYTGLRPGEKLYEELIKDDSEATTQYKSIMIAKPTNYDFDKLNIDIEALLLSDEKPIKIAEIVPEFDHKHHDLNAILNEQLKLCLNK